MEVHFPGLTVSRRRHAGPAGGRAAGSRAAGSRLGVSRPGGGRHTSLVGSGDDDGYPAGAPAGYSQGTRVYIRGETGGGPWPDGYPPGETGYLTGPGSRSSSDYRPGGSGSRPTAAGYRPGSGPDYGPGSGSGSDTVVMGDLGLFSSRRPADWPKVGVIREPPSRPWYQNRARLAIAASGLAAVGIGGFVAVPALLQALGVAPGAQGGACQVCQFPIPSSAAVPPGSGSSPATAPSATSPARTSTRTRTRAVLASPPAPVAVVPQPQSTPAGQTISPLSVTYSATPGGGGQFTGQVTVVNRGAAPITNWQMVVALPYDTVSAVQNAEITDQNGVLFLSPAPEDLSIPSGGTVVVTLFASGPTTTPAECSFNNVPCR
jgi:Cellulose binding domain